MGIDPGLTRMGLAVVESTPQGLAGLAAHTVRTPAGDPLARRLLALWEAVTAMLEAWRPDAIAVERVFHNLNVRTAVPVAQASGIAILAGARSGAPVHEYTPLEVKQAVVGHGGATKEQVRYMVRRLLALAEAPATADAADAFATAICHLHGHRLRSLAGAAP